MSFVNISPDPMVRLSVNVNKVATVRNSRGGRVPSVLAAVDACLAAGARGITVHPRADQRHITPDDVREIAANLTGPNVGVEFNIEGDPRADLLALVLEVKPDQCTLVPVIPGEVTSQAGWRPGSASAGLGPAVDKLKAAGIRVSVFVDPEPVSIRIAREVAADRVELYTEPFARAFEQGAPVAAQSFQRYAEMAELAHSLGMGVNAGHDLDLDNLTMFRELPHLAEVSIGHAIVARAIFVGLENVVREYLALLAAGGLSGPGENRANLPPS
jgi:pyridoxine 5-phosphate synthase